MAAYYNELDPFAAAWLRELIKAGLIADGEVDERSIELVRPEDMRGFVQCHWFAGIGGWSLALRLASWGDTRPVWTGSCPCQPFSSAGAQAGGHDPRDLWPVWFQLVKECRPVVVFGEQVEAAIGHGWLDRLCDDLEAEDYAIGACGLPGPSVGAFDIRQRLWFVAESSCGGLQRRGVRSSVASGASDQPARSGDAGDVADTDGQRRARQRLLLRPEATGRNASEVPQVAGSGAVGELEHADSRRSGRQRAADDHTQTASSRARPTVGRLGDSLESSGAVSVLGESDDEREAPLGRLSGRPSVERAGSFWAAAEWIACRDGKARPVEPGTFPLAHGVSARVGRLRGYGNAIKPQVAQVFIEAYMSLQEPHVF